MGYYNPLLRYGVARACADIAAAGGDGLIVPDVPPEEITELHQAAQANHLDVILFVSPTTPDERIATITRYASGFLYCVSLTGVTGARQSLSHGLEPFLARVRRHTDLPLVVGFGISTAEHVATVHTMADGAIVGSALIKTIEQAPDDEYVAQAAAYVQQLCTPTTS
jgi:tryptophan synthase alpha chain